ncbi:hypothetical protein GCWU000325_00168 [Alloprevotella tannerae ATCC 51259]|uniref:Uncharacterized protein n=1 Tax=Alloprevotella tannerae ATCC 51259 TaxID=626522 RepID=C9LD99_9BACT|nr:hypothetical protein GCWU000325_00168 [Alloprevotella tannerae ATCC 51259]
MECAQLAFPLFAPGKLSFGDGKPSFLPAKLSFAPGKRNNKALCAPINKWPLRTIALLSAILQ